MQKERARLKKETMIMAKAKTKAKAKAKTKAKTTPTTLNGAIDPTYAIGGNLLGATLSLLLSACFACQFCATHFR